MSFVKYAETHGFYLVIYVASQYWPTICFADTRRIISNRMSAHYIYDGEIFQKSNCIWHENSIMEFFRSALASLGYVQADQNNKIWSRGDRTVIVCLVDDFITCTDDYSISLPYIFDTNTVVITDNWTSCPTQYQIHRLPSSFYGIYAHTPAITEWAPDRRLNLSINRIDGKRLHALLELQKYNTSDLDDIDYINFNCWDENKDTSTVEGLSAIFSQEYYNLAPRLQAKYDKIYNKLLHKVPIRNHALTQEQAHVRSWINVIMETYSSDTNIALSEKIFRAMCLPVPWQVYSGQHTISYLHHLGFDTLQDLLSHNYDNKQENTTLEAGDNKMTDFIFEGILAATNMQKQNCIELKQRLEQAAFKNRELLHLMRRNWHCDFAAWWPTVLTSIR